MQDVNRISTIPGFWTGVDSKLNHGLTFGHFCNLGSDLPLSVISGISPIIGNLLVLLAQEAYALPLDNRRI